MLILLNTNECLLFTPKFSYNHPPVFLLHFVVFRDGKELANISKSSIFVSNWNIFNFNFFPLQINENDEFLTAMS